MGRMRGTNKDELKKRGKVWYTYYYPSDGRLVEKTLGTTSKADALVLLVAHKARTEAEIEVNGVSSGTMRSLPKARRVADSPPMDAFALMEAWDIARAQKAGGYGEGRHKGTIGQIEYCWRNLRRHLKATRQLSRRGLAEYVVKRRAEKSPRAPRGPSNKTLQAEMVCLKRGLTQCDTVGPMPLLKGKDYPDLTHLARHKCQKTSGQYLEPSDCRALIPALLEGRSGEEHAALFVLHLLTGIRKQEAQRMRPEMIRTRERFGGMAVLELPATATKNGLARAVPLVPQAERAARLLASTPRIKEHRTAFGIASRKVGMVEAPSLRDCRSTFITTCDESGLDHVATRYIAGHFSEKRDSNAVYQKATPTRLVAAAVATAKALRLERPGVKNEGYVGPKTSPLSEPV